MKIGLPCACAALLCIAAAAPDSREANFLASSGLPADTKVVYLDAQGKSIGFDAFFAQAVKGNTFNFEHEGKSATARLDAAKPTAAPAKKGPAYKIAAGDPFPLFALATTTGVRIGSTNLRGKPTLVNFFYSECAPCIAEIPAMNAYARQHPEVRVLAVTYDELATAKQFVAQRKLQWPVAAGGQGLVDAVGVKVYPTFVLLGGDGRVLAVQTSPEIAGPGKVHAVNESKLAAWVARHSKPLTR
jgi:peroxiredoxin